MFDLILLCLIVFVVVIGVVFSGWWFLGGRIAQQSRSRLDDEAVELLKALAAQDDLMPSISRPLRNELDRILARNREHRHTRPRLGNGDTNG